MLARARTFTIDGLQTRAVTVEVDIRRGLPAFTIVGLAGTAVREARDRVQAAILNSGFEFPSRRITANLAPGDVPKAGPGLDLALACAILAASDQLDPSRLRSHALLGELALDGRLRPCRGTLAIAQACVQTGFRTLVLAPQSAGEALLMPRLDVAAAGDLREAVDVLAGGTRRPSPTNVTPAAQKMESHSLDLREIEGQRTAVQALVIAAAGGHNLLLSGPPGTGKTMLASRLPSILPPLSRLEAIEVSRIRSVLGTLAGGTLASERPFRAPHHTITAAGLVGGRGGAIGEVTLAHRGVLFLDELSEFSRAALEALRQPLEDGRVAIARAGQSAIHPADFMLVAATNPCPCGFHGEERCRCPEAALQRHRTRLSGPLLDRIDLTVHLRRERSDATTRAASSKELAERVLDARERQARRFKGEAIAVNAGLDARLLTRHARLDARGEALLAGAGEASGLSARGAHRVLKVARTIADLRAAKRIAPEDLASALALRSETGGDERLLSNAA